MRPAPALRLLTVLACAAVCACSAGTDTETVFRTLTEEDGGSASFEIDMPDSTGSYSMSLITRIQKGCAPAGVTLDITLTSPSGATGTETVSFPSDYQTVRRYIKEHPEDDRIRLAGTPGYYDISWVYRSRIIPPERGLWHIDISLPDTADGKVLGLGITLEHHGKGQDT